MIYNNFSSCFAVGLLTMYRLETERKNQHWICGFLCEQTFLNFVLLGFRSCFKFSFQRSVVVFMLKNLLKLRVIFMNEEFQLNLVFCTK